MQVDTRSNKNRGAQLNAHNRFSKNEYGHFHQEGIDDWEQEEKPTQYFEEHPKKVVNKINSPDIPLEYSLNPYQGCEHGCVYCYARNSHEYWGFSAGQDFEQKIIIKKNAAERLEELFQSKKWTCAPISLSGNTDCYQPAERKQKITRKVLEVCLKYQNPVGIITKNKLVLRDLDLLKKLNEKKLVTVFVSITGIDEKVRRKLEPRTATYHARFEVIKQLSENNIPVGVMNAPIIPGLNDHAMYEVLRQAKLHGANWAGFTTVRLNGALGPLFTDWAQKAFPLKAEKILSLIANMHEGKLSSNQFGKRMRGTGNIADMINKQFTRYTKLFKLNEEKFEYNTAEFIKHQPGQLRLF
jgi:DNA repair photolyase